MRLTFEQHRQETKMIQVVHASEPALLREARPVITVEAEYGSDVVLGSLYTAAHHQPLGSPFAGDHVVAGGRPSPCNDTNIPVISEGIIGISHFDLDTVGGVLRAIGAKDLFCHEGFWRLAAFVDVTGPHRIHLSGADAADIARLYAWWAFSRSIPRLPMKTVNDVTETIHQCAGVLREILSDDPARLQAGEAFRSTEVALNSASFVEMRASGVLIRVAPNQGDFVNHLYTAPDGAVARAVIGFNPHVGTVTVSLEASIPGISCRDLVQGLWGPLAGGHPNIAGSPRGTIMDEGNLNEALAALEAALP
jgi:hypothetical protein